LIEFAFKFTLCGYVAYAVFAITKVWKNSRIIGLIALGILFALTVFSKFNALPIGHGLPRYELTSPAQRGGAFLGNIFMLICFWILFFRFGFSKKVRQLLDQSSN